ncbi:O-antigen ligase family protein [Thalassolituus alkanivorans]|uniref:O-antigen ligase family protein n=1 Tax=Thalassolituus alkanivorans TaxID=2881055 RepID=UPI001E3FFD23|nr:O-antigen ligase family protein [Thalassolituus alkanivorans]MCB2385706.1 O-antigen ligase family protein [Thalassolituus alkanivorans]MCB2424106.1 O-antigen ligase family protein [Thalassolituus alkanivorans]
MIISIFFAALFLPGHLGDWWLERFFIIGISLLGYMYLLVSKDKILKKTTLVLVFLVSFSSILSVVCSPYFEVMTPTSLMELIRPFLLFGLFFWVGLNEKIRRPVNISIVSVVLLGWVFLTYLGYKYDIPLISDVLKFLYGETKTVVEGSWVRVSSPFENPNFLAFFLVLLFVVQVSYIKSSILGVVFTVFYMVAIYMTGSRTGWGAFLIVGFLIASYNIYAVTFMLASILAVFLAIHFTQYYTGMVRVDMAFDVIRYGLIEDQNFYGRLVQFQHALHQLSDSPLLGVGPFKGSQEFSIVDNQYFSYLLKWGVVGTLLYFFLIYRFFKEVACERFNRFQMIFIVIMAIMLMSGAFLDNYRLFVLSIFMFAFLNEKKGGV